MDTHNKRTMMDESLPIDVRRAAFRAHNRGESGDRTIRFTADIVTPDGSDTDAYGEPCLPGHGYKVESGWWAPEFSRFDVSDDPTYATTFVYHDDPDAEGPVEWLVTTLRNLLPGGVEDSDGRNYYAAGVLTDHATGTTVRPCAHIEGFSDEEIEAADAVL